MSSVTNIIIATSISEDTSYLKAKFTEFKVNGRPFNLVSVDSEQLPKAWYGGSKFLEANLFIGAYSHLDLEALTAFIKENIKWELAESVQLIVKGQGDTKFRVIDLFPE